MEALDGLAQRSGEVSELCLELSDALATLICKGRGVSLFVCYRPLDEYAYSPEIAVLILVVKIAVRQSLFFICHGAAGPFHYCEHLSHRVTSFCCNLCLDMLSNHKNVVHHPRNIRENHMVFPLEDVLRTFESLNDEGVIDKSRSERLYLGDCSVHFKFRRDVKVLFHSAIVYL